MATFMYKEFDQKSQNWRDFHLNFVQYTATRANLGRQIWYGCLQ